MQSASQYIIFSGHWANIIPVIFLSPLGSIQPIMCNHFWCYRANQTQLPPLPSLVPIYTPGWREAITVKCLAQGHTYYGRGWDSNSHSNDSAIRTYLYLSGTANKLHYWTYGCRRVVVSRNLTYCPMHQTARSWHPYSMDWFYLSR